MIGCLPRVIPCVLPAICLASMSAAAKEEADWQAGAASVVITPDEPVWMGGYAARKAPSQGKVHDLFTKALVVEDGAGRRIVIVTADLLTITPRLRTLVEQQAEQCLGIAPDQLLMNASHTHCGPELRDTYIVRRGGTVEFAARARQLVKIIAEKMVEAIRRAMQRKRRATLTYSFARAGFAMNRRLPFGDGIRNSPNPAGPVDHDVPVLLLTGTDSRPIAMLFGYACHNTTLSFQKLCGDYAGFAQAYLEDSHPGAVALFVAGCGGDQNPYPRRTLALARQHGRALANAVEAALDVIAPREIAGSLRSDLDYVTLKFAPPPTREELRRRTNNLRGRPALHAQRLLQQLREGDALRTEYGFPLQVIQFGRDLTLVALCGEAVVDYSLRLKSELQQRQGDDSFSEPPRIWIAAYSNHVFGYLPSRRVLEEGGYEGGRAMISTDYPGPFAPSVEDRIVGKVKQMVNGLR